MMKIKDVAKLAGITVRTLHYYDEIGVLVPSKIEENGYRLYNDVALERLQQILFFRELDFSLKQISEIMTSPGFKKDEALTKHKDLLMQKRDRLDQLINLVDKTIKGEKNMSFKAFDMTEIEKSKKKYAAEVKERWGNTEEYVESEEKTSGYNKDRWSSIDAESSAVFRKFAAHMDKAPDHPEVQALVKQWQNFISEKFYKCTTEILEGLGLMYVEDERFKTNIDAHGEGLALFISEAIMVYCKSK